jgi:hypothetical protein
VIVQLWILPNNRVRNIIKISQKLVQSQAGTEKSAPAQLSLIFWLFAGYL